MTDSAQFNTYRRQPVTFVRGSGARLWDDQGKSYLDYFSGLAVCNLGHAHPAIAQAVAEQSATLVHTSNLYHTQPQEDLAKQLVKRTFPSKVFLCNSGTEANEAAIKLARRFGHRTPVNGTPRHEIVVFSQSFHGRTLGSLSATIQGKYQEGFGPLLQGFRPAVFGDSSSVKQALSPLTCAILVEPIQGEGGVRTASPDFFRVLRKLAQEKNLLLIFDEVQTGLGRTGTLYAYQNEKLMPSLAAPDIFTTAKALANGLPIGAVVARPELAALFQPGDHASTFGGGPVVCRAALAVLNLLTPKLLDTVVQNGDHFQNIFQGWKKLFPALVDVRGCGHMWGLEFDRPMAPLVDLCREAGLLINVTAEKVVRLLPPLILSRKEIEEGLEKLQKCLEVFFPQSS